MFDPKVIKDKKYAADFFDEIKDNETKDLLTSIFVQSKNSK